MPYTTAGKNIMLNALGITQVGLYNGDPEGAGVELSGGSPVYARVGISFNTAAAGSIDSASQPTLNVPAGGTPSYVAFFAGATLVATNTTGETAYGSQGTYQITDADLDLNL
jgi:hypothetical protein